LTGCLYLLGGILGLFGNGAIFATGMWGTFLIAPFPLFVLMTRCLKSSRWTIHGFLYHSSLQPLDHNFLWFTLTVILVSSLAIWVAAATAKNSLFARAIWVALVLISLMSARGQIAADLAGWGVPPFVGTVSIRSVFCVCLSHIYNCLCPCPNRRDLSKTHESFNRSEVNLRLG
jgi:hypothetical protein